MTEAIDDRLPERVVIDTSVLISLVPPAGAAAQNAEVRSRHALSLKLVRRCMKERVTISVPAPALFEFLRSDEREKRIPIFNSWGFEVLAFDDIAGFNLAKVAPADFVEKYRIKGEPRTSVTFDVMIVGCGQRHAAGVLVSFDEEQRERSDVIGLPGKHPRELVKEADDAPLLALVKDEGVIPAPPAAPR